MLRRKAWETFEDWLAAPTWKALLVRGTRQVGKSYLAAAFADEHFNHVAKFDLVLDREARASFELASSPDDLLLRISVAADKPLVSGDTAIIIDEVQEAPNIVTLVKGLVQRGDFRYILTGSLLGVKLENIDSLPVGYATQLEMYPLDFEEYCWARGLSPDAFDMARGYAGAEEPLPDFLYERMTRLYHEYLLVGGMPDAVATFTASGSIDDVRDVHAGIHALYRDDITKYAPKGLRLTIREIYDLIPSEIGSKNKRFRLSSITDVKRFSQVTDDFLWLSNAGVALPVHNVNAPVAPLLVAEQRNLFKLFYLDVGMLASCYPKRQTLGLLDGRADMNMGGVYESAVAQQLKAHGFALRYFTSKKVGELDFLAESMDGSVCAIEVKSGSGYLTHAALDNALGTRGYTIDRAIVLAETNVRRCGPILYLPAFCASILEYE